MHSFMKSTTARNVSAVLAASSLLLVGACSSNPEPSSAPTVPPAESSAAPEGAPDQDGNSDSTKGFMGTAALPEPIQNLTPAPIKEKIGSCVESDDAKPIILGSESVHGFTCVMGTDSGSAAMVTTAEDPATVQRINEIAESVENYAPYDLPGKRAFSGVNNSSPFVMIIDETNKVYQEFVFANVPADQAQPLIDEVIQDYQQG
ncbi:MAG: hypothetical protein Q4E11_05685 [Corynebacterium sp.]|uniref:hypothetical protein n=1 Tax=Corynebacterium sp. TaxID=1720 RepID=UPI0026DB4CDF|nr:hypothetical protein [Corynebacterium sp.]MDO5030058.1 hypothetical protein [Corynebacterium sp.]